MPQAIIITGNAVTGFEFYGPFNSEYHAIQFGNTDPLLPDTWVVGSLIQVEKEDPLQPANYEDIPSSLVDTTEEIMETLAGLFRGNLDAMRNESLSLYLLYKKAARALPFYRHGTYEILINQEVTDEELHPEDKRRNPTGSHHIIARDYEDALDIFHRTVPIENIDHFRVLVKPIDKKPYRSGRPAGILRFMDILRGSKHAKVTTTAATDIKSAPIVNRIPNYAGSPEGGTVFELRPTHISPEAADLLSVRKSSGVHNQQPYLKREEAAVGVHVSFSSIFSCVIKDGETRVIKMNQVGKLYVDCKIGEFPIEDQLSDDGEYYVGIYMARDVTLQQV